jgi:hypothetical protein
MALDFALLLDCNPVIFVGQDLAHTDGRIYCTGTCFDGDWFVDVRSSEEWAIKLESLRSSRRSVIVEDIFGHPIESTDKLIAYWNWMVKAFQENPQITPQILAVRLGIPLGEALVLMNELAAEEKPNH